MIRRPSVLPSERAVSDAMGFVLVFTIIAMTLTTVYIYGFQGLNDAREFERMNNAERAFDVLADNVEEMTQRGAPSRATEVKLADASLQAGEVGTITVRVERSGNPAMNRTVGPVQYQPIVYQSERETGNRLYYELGATFRQSGRSTAMAERPPIVLNEDRALVPIVRTRQGAEGDVTGSSTVLIETRVRGSDVRLTNRTHSSDVTVNISTSRAEAWQLYFQESGATCPEARNNATFVSCTVTDVDVVYVTYFDVRYEFT